MWSHQAKRNLLRDIRKANQSGDKELAKKLTALPEYFWNSGIYIFNIDYYTFSA